MRHARQAALGRSFSPVLPAVVRSAEACRLKPVALYPPPARDPVATPPHSCRAVPYGPNPTLAALPRRARLAAQPLARVRDFGQTAPGTIAPSYHLTPLRGAIRYQRQGAQCTVNCTLSLM